MSGSLCMGCTGERCALATELAQADWPAFLDLARCAYDLRWDDPPAVERMWRRWREHCLPPLRLPPGEVAAIKRDRAPASLRALLRRACGQAWAAARRSFWQRASAEGLTRDRLADWAGIVGTDTTSLASAWSACQAAGLLERGPHNTQRVLLSTWQCEWAAQLEEGLPWWLPSPELQRPLAEYLEPAQPEGFPDPAAFYVAEPGAVVVSGTQLAAAGVSGDFAARCEGFWRAITLGDPAGVAPLVSDLIGNGSDAVAMSVGRLQRVRSALARSFVAAMRSIDLRAADGYRAKTQKLPPLPGWPERFQRIDRAGPLVAYLGGWDVIRHGVALSVPQGTGAEAKAQRELILAVLRQVERRPGCTARDLATHLRANTAQIKAALVALLASGSLREEYTRGRRGRTATTYHLAN